MNIKKCPACDCKLLWNAEQCPSCGLEKMDQLFLSEAAYKAWVTNVLAPHLDSLRLPQVFGGRNHALILLGNGDLYAIGNNYNDACGEDLPRELKTPALVAREVVHAAASPNHTIYVNRDGEVTLLGNSDLTDRFDCLICAKRVYAAYNYEAFLIEDKNGELYYFGENGVPHTHYSPEEEILRDTLPEVTAQMKSVYDWKSDFHGTDRTWEVFQQTLEKGETLPYSVYFNAVDFSQLQQIIRERWYRELLMKYGEKNIKLKCRQLSTKTLEKTTISDEKGERDKEVIEEWTYHPIVVLRNEMIYQPISWEEREIPENFRYSLTTISPSIKNRLKYAVKVMTDNAFGNTDENAAASADENVDAYLEENGDFYISPYIEIPKLPEIADFAVNPEDAREDYILLVTNKREVFLGSRKKLNSEKNWDHLKKLF